ncbi:SDR family NAD(P)-dependent oxidoreductase [Sorangium sp. So ce426]|uniref:SDR family NAD(P)-dependent oxidoreductase n=1 Tax=Sorangium sp. So ce426 TaxID=3133312 RepID=UPI003F5BF60C
MSTANSGSRIWFITGASSGFGRAIAEEALRRGDAVVAAARGEGALAGLAAEAPARVEVVRLDVTKPDDIRRGVAAALARFGRIDVLVNNAGYSLVGAVEETGDEELRAAMEAMFFGAVALTREVLPHMRGRKSGAIVQITSMGGLTTGPGFGAYCAAKHALEGLSECMAAELAPLGVRVLIVEPGAFRTRLFGGAFRSMPALDAYAPTVGATRAYAAGSDGSQPGDPAKAARAIVDAVGLDPMPLRLPLGADAVSGIRAKLASVAADVDRTEAIALDTTVDAAAGGAETS